MAALTPGVVLISLGCLAAGSWLWWHREAPKTTTCLFLTAGAAFGGVIGHALASPATLLVAGALGLAATATGLWMWWLHGGRVTDSLASLILLAGGGLLVCIVVARTCTLLLAGAWANLIQLVLAAGVLLLAAEVVVKGMWKGRARPRRYHPWLALALPTLAIAIGVPVLGPLMTGLSSGLATAGAAFAPPPTAHSPLTAGGHR